ncbi:hypothetical protein MMIN_11800 [Mycolicibacter minnesotensis]|nr:hypothetical protein MMIN_11800 [Mycolicibacter minnesotensis]
MHGNEPAAQRVLRYPISRDGLTADKELWHAGSLPVGSDTVAQLLRTCTETEKSPEKSG